MQLGMDELVYNIDSKAVKSNLIIMADLNLSKHFTNI